MQPKEKFSFLRKVLTAIGQSEEATDEIVSRIEDLLSDKDKSASPVDFPYFVRDDFLSPAEFSFFMVLKTAVADTGLVLFKVGLGDLFYVKSHDPSKYRTATNRIDRKHVDFLVCDPKTVRPLVGIELDDQSHRRADRQERDEFVDRVFKAAKLPILRVPARRSYSVSELAALVGKFTGNAPAAAARAGSPPAAIDEAPLCPKCNGEMMLRTAKNGPNAGERFWGCMDYPACRGVVKYGGNKE